VTFEYFYPNGVGGSGGDSFISAGPMVSSGQVYFVDSATGSDSNSGLSHVLAKATLSSAYSAASTGDIIVLMNGHTESLASALTISKGLFIIGEGQSDSKPTVKLRTSSAGDSLLIIDAAVEIRNVWFQTATQSNSASRISVTSPNGVLRMKGCYLELSVYDTLEALRIENSSSCIEDTTFISVATAAASVPVYALRLGITGSATLTRMSGVTIDGGGYGFSSSAMVFTNGSVRCSGLTLSRGANAVLACDGYLIAPDVDDTSSLTFTSAFKLLPSGLGCDTGDDLGTLSPLYTTGTVYYVDSAAGNNSYDGKSRVRAFATLATATAAAAAHDIIVLCDGHTETITSGITLSVAATILGDGIDDDTSDPTPTLTFDAASGSLLILNSWCDLRNVTLAASSQATAAARVRVTSTGCRVVGCVFYQGVYDDHAALSVEFNTFDAIDCSFEASATSNATQPPEAFYSDNDAVRLTRCTFDHGSYGYSTAAIRLAATVEDFFGEDLTFISGAGMRITTGATGKLHVGSAGGFMKIQLDY
jgi:hypothetical protein